jgi:hypothetical protein
MPNIRTRLQRISEMNREALEKLRHQAKDPKQRSQGGGAIEDMLSLTLHDSAIIGLVLQNDRQGFYDNMTEAAVLKVD